MAEFWERVLDHFSIWLIGVGKGWVIASILLYG